MFVPFQLRPAYVTLSSFTCIRRPTIGQLDAFTKNPSNPFIPLGSVVHQHSSHDIPPSLDVLHDLLSVCIHSSFLSTTNQSIADVISVYAVTPGLQSRLHTWPFLHHTWIHREPSSSIKSALSHSPSCHGSQPGYASQVEIQWPSLVPIVENEEAPFFMMSDNVEKRLGVGTCWRREPEADPV